MQRERGLTATEQSEREQAFIVARCASMNTVSANLLAVSASAGAQRDEEVLQHDQSVGGALCAVFVDEPCGTR